MKVPAFYIKMSRYNGQTMLLCEPNSNRPQIYSSMDEAKAVAKEAISRIVVRKTKGRTPSPAAIDKVWIYQTTRTIPDVVEPTSYADD